MASFDPELEPHLNEAARLNNLDPMLLRALFAGESSNDPNATSPKGAGGLAQIMPDTAKKYGVADPYDPVQAIYGGAKILNDHLTKAEQSGRGDIRPIEYALKSYFGGEEGPQWGPKTAAYPSYIASKYAELTGPQNGVAVKPLSNSAAPAGVEQLAALATNAAPSASAAPNGVAQLAQAGRAPQATPGAADISAIPQAPAGTAVTVPGMPNAQQAAQAAPQAIPSDDELLRGLQEVAPLLRGQAAASGGPVTGAPAATPPANPGQPLVKYADPNNSLYPMPLRQHLMTFPEGQAMLAKIIDEEKSGVQRNRDGTMSPIQGGPLDPNLQFQGKRAEMLGHEGLTVNPQGTIQNSPGATEAAAGKAGAVGEAQEVPRRVTAAEAPRELRGAGTSILYPPGSAGARQFIDSQKSSGTLPAGTKINPDGSVEVGNVNVPPEVVHQRYTELTKLGDEAHQARLGIYEANQLKQKLREIGTSGPMTDYLGKLSALAQQIGVPEATIKSFALPPGAKVEEANKLSTDLLGAILHQTFPGRITNTDITAWKNTVPRTTTLQEANDFLIDKIVAPKFQRAIDRYGYASSLSANDPQLTTYYKALNDWDTEHPFDAYQIASEFKPAGAAPAPSAQPDRAAVEQEMRRRGLLK